MTTNAAYAAFEEDTKGKLIPGMLADIVVLSRDILSVSDADELPGDPCRSHDRRRHGVLYSAQLTSGPRLQFFYRSRGKKTAFRWGRD